MTKLGSYGTYGLHVIQYPSGRFGYVGTIPAALCVEKKGTFGEPVFNSRSFETEQDAIDFFTAQNIQP